ncbi:hypothetical protein ACFL0P_00435 [Candidatus Omnitrophota bacterium]
MFSKKEEMNKKQLIAVIALISIISVCISGCRSVYVGGSGKIGGVTGSGGVSIPIPKQDLETDEKE